jgi:hypothetical protein
MSGPNAMDDEMSGFSFPGRPGDEPLLDMVFDRCPLPPEAPAEIHGLAQLLVALAGPAEPGELAGEAAARGAFTRVASPAGVLFPDVRPAGRRRSSRRPGRGRVRLAAALLTTAAGLGSLAAAACAGVLPSSVQSVAHTVAGPLAPAPPVHHHHHAPHGPAAVGAPRDTRSRPSPVRSHPTPRPRLGPAHPHRIDQYAGNATIPNPIFDHGSPRPSYRPPTRSCATLGPRPVPGSASCTPTPTPTPAPTRTPAPTASPRRLRAHVEELELDVVRVPEHQDGVGHRAVGVDDAGVRYP